MKPKRDVEPSESFRDQVRAWWTSVLRGKVDQPYPVHGFQVKAGFEGELLVVSGTVPTEAARQELRAEVERLERLGFAKTRFGVTVVTEVSVKSGPMIQTIVATFETGGQARFAATHLSSLSQLDLVSIRVVEPDRAGSSEMEPVPGFLPEDQVRDVRAALADNHAVVILAVDEARAVQTREILDEDTQSLRTVVLPPEPRTW